MRPGEVFHSEAIILQTTPYEETHKLVRLLLPGFGKLSCFARFAQRSTKRFGAFLQPGSLVRAHLKVPRGEVHHAFYSLEFIEGMGEVLDFRNDFQKLQSLMFVLSLLNSVLPDGPVDDKIYEDLKSYRSAIDCLKSKSQHQWVRMLFWLNLSLSMGHMVRIPEVSQKMKVLLTSLYTTTDFKTLDYKSIGSLDHLPDLTADDFKKVSNEWRRVSENLWDYTRVLY